MPVITSREIQKFVILKRLLITIFLKYYRVFGVAEARDKLGPPPHCSAAKPSAPCPHGIWQSLAGAVTYREAEPLAGPAQDTPPRPLQRTAFHCHLAVLKHQFTSRFKFVMRPSEARRQLTIVSNTYSILSVLCFLLSLSLTGDKETHACSP